MGRGGRTEGGITEMRRGAVTRGRRRGSNLSGLGPGKRKERARPKSPSASLLVPTPSTRATTNGDGEQSTGAAAMARRRKRGRLEGKELGFKEGGNVGLGTDLGRSRRELALGGRGQSGDREDDAGGGKRGKRRGRKGLALLPIREKGGGERGRRDRGRRGAASVPWRLARGVAGAGR
uniref:Epstein-Barr virus EBNA-1-like n=1 Tax=Oryza sativa subsp. japonica TaxID=39947 RepID=Q5SMM5_ORYSJ|nr:Epstein-Barr virus EBNA-1-like [Oryza sativa Japonica Group]BAD72531.1 Epstein-Barr virus EBNA-1-like [Oryza sativa Japonica Group]